MSKEILHLKIDRKFDDITSRHEVMFEFPSYLQENLDHKIRYYQEQAMRHFIYTQRSDAADLVFNHLLFHMATGSGKTLVMAASILYLYQEKGYQNFLFFADSDAIVKKTKDNLTNSASPKYLFNPKGIVIEGRTIHVQTVDVFPQIPSPNTIYLLVTSIQKLHGDLTEPKENGLTYDYLENMSFVMLADEAHHYLAETKRDKKNVSKKEAEIRSWEVTIDKLLSLNQRNRLLGFSATFNLDNELLFEKLQDKIVYQYDLKVFMESGYSKNVVLLQANEDDRQKMLQAVLLSQYRKYIARDHGVDLKPIILFKSNNIAKSLESNQIFMAMIENITVRQLEEMVRKGASIYSEKESIWHQMYKYYERTDMSAIVRDLQWDFTGETTLNANDSQFMSAENALLLNTLEEPDNPIRTIFAVAKLNEGWDVLNLFDIVRISEGASSTRITTDSEAQLIGRGARYYPFVYDGERSYQRRFDTSGNELKVIETLHYHTINDNAYIQNLNKSLEAANIQIKKDGSTRYNAKIKDKFKRTDLYRNGMIYINKAVPTTPDDYRSFNNYNVSVNFEVDYETTVEKRYGTTKELVTTQAHEEKLEVDRHVLQKAIQRNPFYHFSNLRQYVPSISSMDEFITNAEFLGGLNITLTLPIAMSVEDLTPTERLQIVEKFLAYAENRIRTNYMKVKGTPVFYGVSFRELIKDYFVEINQVRGSVTEIVRPKNMRDHDWYIFDTAIANGLEHGMIEFINNYMEKLKQKYGEVYLIRNERKIKIYEIGGVRGFMPDFLLYMKDEDYTYQVFIEPKGDNLREQDQWKEDFLLSLSSEAEVLSENEQVRLIGIKFYSNNADLKQAFREDFNSKILGQSHENIESLI